VDGTGRLVDHPHACLWQPDGAPVDMGTLMPDNAMESMAMGINSIGKAVGWSDTDYGTLVWFKQRRAFIYGISSRKMDDLGLNHSEANGINDWNEVVGAYQPDEYHEHAVYWDSNGTARDLHPFVTAGGGSSKATAINDKGQIVGWADDPESGNHRGFFYDIRQNVVKHATVPDVSGMRQSKIYSINNRGQAVGMYRANLSGYHALLWNVDQDSLEDLNTLLPSEQQWPKAEWPHNESGWLLWEAWGINDMGQITGQGNHSIGGDYRERSFRLTPKS
jgi:probable HAF family extracellular repeat protein